MPSAPDHDTTLRRIADLAAQALAQPDVPPALRATLGEIERLAGQPTADTLEPSDMPHTENQSL